MNYPGGPFPQQNMSPRLPPKLSLAPGAFADLLPLALDRKNSKSLKLKEDDVAVKSLTESRREAKKFEKASVPTLNDLKSLKPPAGDNLLSFD